MKIITHCLVLTTILGTVSLFGTTMAGLGQAVADPLPGTQVPGIQQQAALNVPGMPQPGSTIGLHRVVRVPTPAEVKPVSIGDSPSNTVPPLEITAAEARRWIADAGYTNVSELTLATTTDGVPVYRGTAMADGETYAVIVDSWGNIAGWQ